MTRTSQTSSLFEEDSFEKKGAIVRVLLPLGLPQAYDYRVPVSLMVQDGDFVVVPLGPRQLVGVVWGEGLGDIASSRIKNIIEKLPAPPLPEEVRKFVDWVATYTMTPPGMVLRLAMRAPGALEPAAMRRAYRLAGPPPVRLTPAR
ncbi:MAG: primosomal protein N', partial [Parvibaculaceae bacterium]|nr:primosomal protein N' [Parvibaculaceae bacterium]